MLQESNLNYHPIRHNPIIEGSVNQQNRIFKTTNQTKNDSNIIDYSSVGNRLYQRPDGSIGLDEKSIGFVIGEQMVPLIDSVSSITKNLFGYLKGGVSRVFNFQILPGASAQELEKNVHNSWTKSALGLDFERKFGRGFLPIEDPIHSFSQETALENLNQIVGNLTNLVKDEYVSEKMGEFDWLPDRIQSDSLATQLRAHSMITSVIHAYILEEGKFVRP